MKNLQISEEKAKELYPTASDDFKILLEESFGKAFFLGNVIDRINGWQDMLNETGRPDVPAFSDVPEDLQPYFKAVYKNVVMVEAYNEGERMDIYDADKARHYPWFRNNGSPSAFRFDVSLFVYSNSNAGSGSRHRLLSREASDYIGKTFPEVWKNVQLM